MSETNPDRVFIETIKLLTKRQIDILEKVAEGKTNGEIARELFIEKSTVKKHKSNICKKLKLSGRNALLKWVIRNYGPYHKF